MKKVEPFLEQYILDDGEFFSLEQEERQEIIDFIVQYFVDNKTKRFNNRIAIIDPDTVKDKYGKTIGLMFKYDMITAQILTGNTSSYGSTKQSYTWLSLTERYKEELKILLL